MTGPSFLYQTSRDFSTGFASAAFAAAGAVWAAGAAGADGTAGAGVSPLAPLGSDRNKGNKSNPVNVPSAKRAQIFFRACFVTVAITDLLETA